MGIIRVEVKKINYVDEKTHYYIFEGLTRTKTLNSTGKEVVKKTRECFLGTFLNLYVGDEIMAEGEWIENTCYGKQFKVESYNKVLPQTIKGIQAFLKSSVKGLGDIKAKALTDAYGEDTLSKIAEDINNLNVLSVKKETKENIYHAVIDNREFEDLLYFMKSNGLDHSYAIKVYEIHKNTSMLYLRQNPYDLFFSGALKLKEADRIAKSLDLDSHNPERIAAGLYSLLSKDCKNKGNLFSYEEFIIEKIGRELKSTGIFEDIEVSKEEKEKALDNLKSKGYIIRDTHKKTLENIIYLGNNKKYEKIIFDEVKKRLLKETTAFASNEALNDALRSFEEKSGIELSTMQKAAVKLASRSNISIITGLPGTGKTQTMAALLYAINYIKADAVIKLCSPTGKAAKRMSEVSGADAQTIHRLAKIYDQKCYDTLAPETIISGDFVIIDEASLIDARICSKLLASININSKIVFIGDYEQLPSIGPGLILRDFVESEIIPVAKLDKIFRQSESSHIISNAHKICKGESFEGFDFDKSSSGSFFFFDEKDALKTRNKILNIIKSLLKTYSISDIQVLSPIAKTVVGVDSLNSDIQTIFGSGEDMIDIGDNIFYKNDKVIHTVNNYDLSVFNGETGVIKENEDLFGKKIVVDYKDKVIEYEGDNLKELKLAYAITVHKSQGSEFPVVIMPIIKEHEAFLSRSLIYTACTRAKQQMILVGDSEVFKRGLEKTENRRRNSQLKEMLKEIKYSV